MGDQYEFECALSKGDGKGKGKVWTPDPARCQQELQKLRENAKADPVNCPGNKIAAFGFPTTTTQDQIAAHFAQFGRVSNIDMKYNLNSGEFRGFCFVAFEECSAAEMALE